MSNVTITTSSVLEKTAVITIDSTTYGQLLRNNVSAVLLSLPKGLQGWNRGHGTALDEFKAIPNAESYILLLDNADQVSEKGRKFITALTEMMGGLGKKIVVPAVEPGVTTDVLAYEQGEQIAENAFADNGFTEATEEGTDGPKIFFNAKGGIDATNTGYAVLSHILTPSVDSQSGKVYLVPNENTPAQMGRRAVALGSDAQRHLLSYAYFQTTGEVLPRSSQPSIEDTAAGLASLNENRITTVSRTYQDSNGVVWIDLGREDCKCVKLTKNGWSIEDMPVNSERVFIKDGSVREIATDPVQPGDVPKAIGTLDRILRPLFNVTEDDWHLIVGWMVNHLLAERVSPILMMLGTGGSGKSTMCNAISYAVEGGPSFPRSGAMKSEVDDVMVTIAKKRVSVFDNVSKLSGELSDTLAQAVYGMDYEKRELRTTDSVAVIKVNPSLILNGITTGHLREDLKSRMVTIRIAGTVPTDKQKDDLDIVREQTEGHAEVYGALLTIASAVMHQLETQGDVQITARMKEYGRVLHALDDMLGWNALDQYLHTDEESAEDALEDPLLATVVYLVRKNGVELPDGSWQSYVGTSQLTTEYNMGGSTFAARLSGEKHELSPRSVPDRFSRVQGDWKKIGVVINVAGKLTGSSRPRIDGVRQAAYQVTVLPKAKSLIEDAEAALAKTTN